MDDTGQARGVNRALVLSACFAAVGVVGLVDRATGPYVALSIFYAAPVLLAAFLCGRWAGWAMAAASAFAGLIADFTNPGLLGSAFPTWNAAVRLTLFLVMAEVAHRLSEALRRERAAAEQLREVDRMKDSILQAIAHDLQDPLSGILAASIALVRERGTPGTDTQLLTRGLASMARKVARLIGEVLDAERLSRGILDISRNRTEVGELVRGLVEQRIVEGFPAGLIVQADTVWASVDAGKVERAVDSLLQHVSQHKKRRGPVRVRVEECAGVLISVEDAGLASYPAMMNLRPLVLGEAREVSANVPGLDYASIVACLHGGKLSVETRPRRGIVFCLLLPEPQEAEQHAAG